MQRAHRPLSAALVSPEVEGREAAFTVVLIRLLGAGKKGVRSLAVPLPIQEGLY
jgi:hypothetical protein